ncbi:MAG: hypothetical protein IJ813_02790 [Bacteroidales bacterium]|nr:hypothetical protein [Bacteroidales bacterium]
MKKKITLLLLAGFWGLSAAAQECTTTWPYLYDDFKEGTIFVEGLKPKTALLNIYIKDGHLHFIDKEIVREANAAQVGEVVLGEDHYYNVSGCLMKVVASSENGLVLERRLGDFSALLETGGAYGVASNTSATRKLSSIETHSHINQSHMLLLQGKHDGQPVELESKLFLKPTGKSAVEASARAVEHSLSAQGKAAWKPWKKANKVKWSQPESLLQVLAFLTTENY